MRPRRLAGASLAACAAALWLGTGAAFAWGGDGIRSLEVIGNRADLVSGGDALVAARLGRHTAPSHVRAELNGTDVSAAFALRPNGRYEGLVSGLRVGRNHLTVRIGHRDGKRLTITNHPIGGPVFSGPQVTPYLCDPNASTPPLGPALDAQCNAPTKVDYLYLDAHGQFAPYDPADPPAASDIRSTTTDEGRTVPFIVQRVTGTADRGIYQIAVLVDPSKPITPWSTEQPWSHKVYYTYGGGCGNVHGQRAPGSVLLPEQLGAGFAVATSNLNTFQSNCNEVVSAEATMMVKEIIAERYGEITYTMGNGSSAGSMQQHFLANNYPGLLDGLTVSLTFEDHYSLVVDSFDCTVLWHYFFPNGSPTQSNPLWPTPQSRLPVWDSVPANPDNGCGQKVYPFGFNRVELFPADASSCALPEERVWDPVDRPRGERCATPDFLRSIFGTVPAPDAPNGKGRSATDNVGVQYGLAGLKAGTITPAQFADLNAKVGGLDIDGNYTRERKAADPRALAVVYRSGLVVDGRGGGLVPEIDDRDNPTDTGLHHPFHSWAYRARLDRANGEHRNEVIHVTMPGGSRPSTFDAMREWLDNLAADRSHAPRARKVERAKPASLHDECYLPNGTSTRDLSCDGTFHRYGNPRIGAGGPLTDDVVKCRLKPLRRSDYPVRFTDEQWAQLESAFPTGVCDYSRPGVLEQPAKSFWLTYADGPGGRPLGAPPEATEVHGHDRGLRAGGHGRGERPRAGAVR